MKSPTPKQIIRMLLFVGTAISLYFVPWPIVTAWITPLPNTIQEQVNNAKDYGYDGIVVYVDKGQDKEPEFYTSGYKNRALKTPADPKALFKIASVSKLYVALSIAKLERSGKLSIHKTLSHYLPELDGSIDNAKDITLKMMVTHRSGIPNYTDVPNFWANPPSSEQKILELVLNKPANFEPDQDYEYSNTNYLLLGRVMDRVLGYSHLQYIQQEILNPLHLNNTYTSLNDVNIEDVMSGYYVGYEEDLKTDYIGSMLATAQDLGKFIRALNDGSAFSDAKEQEIYTSLYKFNHTGLIPGYQTIAEYHQDINTVVIQFTNTVNFNGYNWNLSEIMYSRILKILKSKY
ncbi:MULTISPECIES: serine hydrolase domain-containing protein [Croceibacter]|uniref:serine hydrolase domain-containing protein n=1 Tax=Croceibacter TaxID=216431 RepID=UPI000C3E6A16|nr:MULTISPECIES: serine hydrolase domain-containing protein [Croceibacter]MBG25913.1 serine hydrolase [Croceibacter sp.]|tara:strand:+ start:2764 stop:3804 length:1041 start_codon:yes stop_codon:yes gene_type:complete